MNFLTADQSMQDMLRGVVAPIEVRDSVGEVMGYYTPIVRPKEATMYEKVKALFDPEEIKRRKERSRGETGYTLDQVMERLRAMENREGSGPSFVAVTMELAGTPMITLHGTSPNGRTPRVLDVEERGEEVLFSIHPPDNPASGQKIWVKRDELRSLLAFTDLVLRGGSPGAGKPREMAVCYKEEASIYVYPLIEDDDGQLIEGEGGWAIWLRMNVWRDAVVSLLSAA